MGWRLIGRGECRSDHPTASQDASDPSSKGYDVGEPRAPAPPPGLSIRSHGGYTAKVGVAIVQGLES